MKVTVIVKLLCHCACVLFFFSASGFSSANKINIQGTFFQNDGVTPITGASHVVDVRLYTNAIPTAGETIYFGEKHTSVDLATDGKFNILLGQGNLLPEVNTPLDNVSFDKQYFMEVTLDTVTVLGRQILGSSGYAPGSVGNFVVPQDVYAGGKIGIGTSSPQYKLDIQGGDIRLNNNGAGNIYGMDQYHYIKLRDNGTNWTSIGEYGGIRFLTGNNSTSLTERVIISPAGDFGIGTLNPRQKLEVSGDIMQTGRNLWLWGCGATQSQAIMFSGWGVAHGGIYWKGENRTFTLQTGDSADIVGNYGSANLVVTGKVGIGTASPANTLDVQGTLEFGNSGATLNAETNSSYTRYNFANLSIPTVLNGRYLYLQDAEYFGILGGSLQGHSSGLKMMEFGMNHYQLYAGGMKIYATGATPSTLVTTEVAFETKPVNGWSSVERIKIEHEGAINMYGHVSFLAGTSLSDKRLKKNVVKLADNSVEKVMKLQGVTFDWDKDQYRAMRKMGFKGKSQEEIEEQLKDENIPSDLNKKQIGLIAQDVEEIFPEFVYTDSSGYKGVSYDKLTTVLLEAIKQQQKQIQSLQAQIDKLNK